MQTAESKSTSDNMQLPNYTNVVLHLLATPCVCMDSSDLKSTRTPSWLHSFQLKSGLDRHSS